MNDKSDDISLYNGAMEIVSVLVSKVTTYIS